MKKAFSFGLNGFSDEEHPLFRRDPMGYFWH
ncbi:MAG: hypothetical protein JWP94_1897 [Mucilaginibacter sp.]|jgi:hypothetical protein|nr:hypothetical protein [Mucilaginibacter sp.]